MIIDCDACAVRGPACADCVVTVLLGGPRIHQSEEYEAEEDRFELDRRERAALAVLADSGLVPPLRLVPGGSPPGKPARRADPRRAAG